MRIKKLPKGTVSFHTQSEQRFVGVVEKEVVVNNKNASPVKGKEKVPPCINAIDISLKCNPTPPFRGESKVLQFIYQPSPSTPLSSLF